MKRKTHARDPVWIGGTYCGLPIWRVGGQIRRDPTCKNCQRARGAAKKGR